MNICSSISLESDVESLVDLDGGSHDVDVAALNSGFTPQSGKLCGGLLSEANDGIFFFFWLNCAAKRNLAYGAINLLDQFIQV